MTTTTDKWQDAAWLPMETALRDGTLILVSHQTGCKLVRWATAQSDGVLPWIARGTSYFEDCFDGWLPIPQPTAAETVS